MPWSDALSGLAQDGIVRQWDANTLTLDGPVDPTGSDQSRCLVQSIAVSPDGLHLFGLQASAKLSCWSAQPAVATGSIAVRVVWKLVETIPVELGCSGLTPAGQVLWLGGPENTVAGKLPPPPLPRSGFLNGMRRRRAYPPHPAAASTLSGNASTTACCL